MASSSSSSNNKIVVLKSSDGVTLEVDEKAAMVSETIKHFMEDFSDSNYSVIPLPNVTAKILAKVIEYCYKHVVVDDVEQLKQWDAEFVKVDLDTLFELVLAANYMDIKGLLDLTCQTIADLIKDKTVEEIRKIFNINNDFTPEEEAQIRRENQWAFD